MHSKWTPLIIINNNSEVIFDVDVNTIQNKLDEKIPLLMGNIS